MKRRTVYGVTFLVFIVPFISFGCATTGQKSGTDIQALRTQVTDLETKVQQKDAEIDGLRQAMSKTTEDKYDSGKGSSGGIQVPSVAQIQNALKNAGLDPGEADGKLGHKTRRAIHDFQKAHGLTADGKVGPKTWNELAKYTENKASENVQPPVSKGPNVNEKVEAAKDVVPPAASDAKGNGN